jgi:2-polyprenyl-3-methyl-5-hydroxy-6-metoxy-1,4-benzoquinol methylase
MSRPSSVNKICEPQDMQLVSFQALIDDMHNMMKVRRSKYKSFAPCKGKGILEPAQIQSYKHWDYAWAIVHSKVQKGMTVLDAGAGRGFLQYYLARLGVNIHSIDVSPLESKFIRKLHAIAYQMKIPIKQNPYRVTKKLQRRYKTHLEYRFESVSALSYPDNFFDQVFSMSVLEHLDAATLRSGLREMSRVLKPRGLLVLTIDYNPSTSEEKFGFNIQDMLDKIVYPLESYGLQPTEPLNLHIPNWDDLLTSVNRTFATINQCVSYGMIFEKVL